jgi:hypothetical protein
MQALQKVGAPFGAAILGSVLSSAYQAQLNLAGLPSMLSNAVKTGLFGGLAVAQRLGSALLLTSVRTAFVHGMDVSLVVAAGIAAAGFLLALAFLPARSTAKAGRAELAAASPNRRRALLGVLLAVLAREAQKPEPDQALLATLSSTVDGHYPETWSEEQRGKAVAHDVIEPLSIALLTSSIDNEAAEEASGAPTSETNRTIPTGGLIG